MVLLGAIDEQRSFSRADLDESAPQIRGKGQRSEDQLATLGAGEARSGERVLHYQGRADLALEVELQLGEFGAAKIARERPLQRLIPLLLGQSFEGLGELRGLEPEVRFSSSTAQLAVWPKLEAKLNLLASGHRSRRRHYLAHRAVRLGKEPGIAPRGLLGQLAEGREANQRVHPKLLSTG